MQPSEIKWSYSSLKDFQNCPRQYNEVKVLKRFQKKTTPQMLYGTEVHSALENYVKDGTPLLKNYERYKPMLDPLRDMDGEKYPEYRMALDFDRKPSTWGKYWVRGIADLVVIDGDTGFVVDYKTGSDRYPDMKQLQLMALMVFAHFPEVEYIKAGLLFVAHNNFITGDFKRKNIDKMWADFIPHLERLRLCHVNDKWQANPTPLCGWCPVTSCEFYRGKL